MAELSTTAFRAPTPYLIPPASGRNAHTARTLKAAEMHTKLLSIPCTMEKHNVFSMCISAQIATTQISACNNLLEDHALAIARDRVRLSIGYLNTMGSMWALGKAMAKDVRAVARSAISVPSNPVFVELHPTAENEVLRDDLIWPVDPSAQIDIYSGIVMPMDWGTISSSTGSYASSSSSYDVSWSNVEVAKPFDMELSPGGNQ
jgi:nicotinate-nucleotide pyrophosphorylase (carboxylating)